MTGRTNPIIPTEKVAAFCKRDRTGINPHGCGNRHVSTPQQQHHHGRYAEGPARHRLGPYGHPAAGRSLLGHGLSRHPFCGKEGRIPG